MPLRKNYCNLRQAVELTQSKLVDDDAAAELVNALGSGQLKAWLIRDDTGGRIDIPETWWRAQDQAPPYFEVNWDNGWGIYDDKRAEDGRATGEIRIDGSALDDLLEQSIQRKGAQTVQRRDKARQACRALLKELAKGPMELPKAQYRQMARKEIRDLSGRDFDAVWAETVPSDWKQAGRRPKKRA
jgi:hypothetical protein